MLVDIATCSGDGPQWKRFKKTESDESVKPSSPNESLTLPAAAGYAEAVPGEMALSTRRTRRTVTSHRRDIFNVGQAAGTPCPRSVSTKLAAGLVPVLLLLGVTSVGFGQRSFFSADEPAGGPAGSGKLMLLRCNDVGEELRLSDEQREKFARMYQQNRVKRRKFFENVFDGRVFSEPIETVNVRGLLDQWNQDFEKQVFEELLTTSQRLRLEQIELQARGASALALSSIAETLELEPDQAAQIRQRIQSQTNYGPPDNTRIPSSVLRELTPWQQRQLEQLRGELYVFRESRRLVFPNGVGSGNVITRGSDKLKPPVIQNRYVHIVR